MHILRTGNGVHNLKKSLMRPYKFPFTLLLVLLSQLAFTQTTKKLFKNNKGKYVYQITGQISSEVVPAHRDKKEYWIKANHIPVGNIVTIQNPQGKTSFRVKVVDSLGSSNKEYAVHTSFWLHQDLFPNGYFYGDKITVTHQTSLDSLLKSVVKTNPETTIENYKKLAFRFKNYGYPKLEQAPPILALEKMLPQLSKPKEEKLRQFFIDFFGKSKGAVPYLMKYVELYKQQGNQDKEAEYWLRIGDVMNASVDQKSIKQNNYSPVELQDPEKLAKRVAKKTGYPLKDIVRWNRFGGYFSSYRLYYFRDQFKLYPKPEQFSDKAYLEYLKIRQSQGQPDKIVWGLKKLGDLYRLKTGYAKAEEFYLRMEKLRTKGKDKDKLAWVWGYLAKFYWEQKQYAKAEQYFNKIYQLRTQTKDYRRVIWALGGLRYLRYTQGKLDEALAYQKRVLELYEQLNLKDRGLILYAVIKDYLWAFPKKTEMITNYLMKWADEYKQAPALAKKYSKE